MFSVIFRSKIKHIFLFYFLLLHYQCTVKQGIFFLPFTFLDFHHNKRSFFLFSSFLFLLFFFLLSFLSFPFFPSFLYPFISFQVFLLVFVKMVFVSFWWRCIFFFSLYWNSFSSIIFSHFPVPERKWYVIFFFIENINKGL